MGRTYERGSRSFGLQVMSSSDAQHGIAQGKGCAVMHGIAQGKGCAVTRQSCRIEIGLCAHPVSESPRAG